MKRISIDSLRSQQSAESVKPPSKKQRGEKKTPELKGDLKMLSEFEKSGCNLVMEDKISCIHLQSDACVPKIVPPIGKQATTPIEMVFDDEVCEFICKKVNEFRDREREENAQLDIHSRNLPKMKLWGLLLP